MGERSYKHGARLRVKVGASGVIGIKRSVQDGAVVISGTLSVDCGGVDLNALVAAELEAAAREIGVRGGIVGHIKAGVEVTSNSMISVTDELACVKTAPYGKARITLAAIVFLIDPGEAEAIIRKALGGIRSRNTTGET